MPTSPNTISRTTSKRRGSWPRLTLNMQFAVSRRGLPSAKSFRRWAQAALLENVDVTIRLVGWAEGLALNATYRSRDKPTNVLTFVYSETRPLSGDIVLCIPVVKKEARAQDKTLEAHLAHLTVHGMLHLQGLDHGTRHDAELMEGLEAEIISKLGYADPYAETSA
ncbi:MAG: rRNA maturation RNase YbeY [Betaproteobacteria bacterium]|nr:MAG: rRNA maturation RNase YbeY [Betaproteobacteria bacterium]